MGRVDVPTGAPSALRRGGLDIVVIGIAVAASVWPSPVVITSGAAAAALMWAISRRGELSVDCFAVVAARSNVVGDRFPPLGRLRADLLCPCYG